MKQALYCNTEAEFRVWFDKNYKELGVKRIILSQEPCPDYVVEMDDGEIARMEAELFAKNFKYHGHDPKKADYILACYAREEEVEGVPVIAINKLWLFEHEPISPLPPDDPLTEDELAFLSSLQSLGPTDISALCSSLLQGTYSGRNNIYIRLSPETISSIPRGKASDSIFSSIGRKTKEYIKKYHHILIGSNISESACIAIESLTRKGLIKARPISFLAALYDGALIQHDGWIPTEIYFTELAIKYHGQKMKDWHINLVRKLSQKPACD